MCVQRLPSMRFSWDLFGFFTVFQNNSANVLTKTTQIRLGKMILGKVNRQQVLTYVQIPPNQVGTFSNICLTREYLFHCFHQYTNLSNCLFTNLIQYYQTIPIKQTVISAFPLQSLIR